MTEVTFTTKLNKKSEGTYTIEEEITVNGMWEGYLAHDNVIIPSVQIFTGPKMTGEPITNFFVSIPSDAPWKRILKFYASTSKVYVNYETPGDQVEADDINEVQEHIKKLYDTKHTVIDGGSFV